MATSQAPEAITGERIVTVDRLLALVPTLPRPVVLLEDGIGRRGRARLAWGARRRFRLEWAPDHVGALDWLGTLPRDVRVYGSIAYDLGLPPNAIRRAPPVAQPLADFFEPEGEVVLDLATGQVLEGVIPDATSREPTARPPARPAFLMERSFSPAAFEAAVLRIKDYIAAGDVYQVNLALTERFAAGCQSWDLYRRLRGINPSPWMGFADFGDWQIVSGSPELLVELTRGEEEGANGEGIVRTRPIAGTRKKTGDAVRDAAMRGELTLDEKEQAEHRMLLDLARNDLGRVCRYGTVSVREREVVEEYSHVFHLVSEVTGRVDAGRAPWEIVAALFPGGTITGAPKIRAMEVIAELEPVARGAYTGALGWMGRGELQYNILIRSAVLRDGIAVVQAGAGIVWDADPAREWRESLRKGSAMREALGVA